MTSLKILIILYKISKKFWKKYALIIDGLTKIQDVFDKNVSLQAENFQKCFLRYPMM